MSKREELIYSSLQDAKYQLRQALIEIRDCERKLGGT